MLTVSVEELYNHVGHDISIGAYDIDNLIGLECETCNDVIANAYIEHKHTVTLSSNVCEDCGEVA